MSSERQTPVLDVVGDDSCGDEVADYVDHIDGGVDGILQVRKSNGELLLMDDLTGGAAQHEQIRPPTTSDPEATTVGTSSQAKVGTSSKARVGTSSKAKDPSKMRAKTHTFLTCVSQLAMELDKSMKVVTKNDMVELKSMLGQYTDGYKNKTVGTLWRILNEDIKQGYRHQFNLALEGKYHDRIGPVGTYAAEIADLQTKREQKLINLELSKHKADSARITVVAQMADLALKRKQLLDEGVELPAKLARMLDKWSAMPDSGDEEEADSGDEENDEDVDYNEDDGSSGDDASVIDDGPSGDDVSVIDDGSSGDDVNVIDDLNINAEGSPAQTTSKTYTSYVNDYMQSTHKGSSKKRKACGDPKGSVGKRGRG